MSKEIKKDQELKKNIFNYNELKQSDQKLSTNNYINPDFNPGCLSRVRSTSNPYKKYKVEKELYYTRDNKKVQLSKGEIINFTV